MERLYCDVCEDEVELKKEEFGSNHEVKFTYWCSNCNHAVISNIKYPRVIEKEVEEYLVYNDE